MARRILLTAARVALLSFVALVSRIALGSAAGAQTPTSSAPRPSVSTSSSVIPSLGTAAAPTPVDSSGATVATIKSADLDRPLTTSEQRLEWLDKYAIGGFVVLTIVIVLVRQRRPRHEIDPEDQPDDVRDEWDTALTELTAQYRLGDDAARDHTGDRAGDIADDAAGDR